MRSPRSQNPAHRSLPRWGPHWKPEEREKHALRPGFKRNLGKKPSAKKGQRVIVALMSGKLCGDEPVTKESKLGWEIDTTNWNLTGWWFDVDQFKVI